MMKNGTVNYSVFSQCSFVSEHLHLAKTDWQTTVMIMVIVICGTRLLLELLELFQQGFYYFKVDNIVDLFCYVSAILVVWDWDTCSSNTGLRLTWQWELGAFTLTLTWLNFLSLIRKVPFFGIYVVMFIDVSYTFIKVSGVVILFIIAFSLGFNVLLSNQQYFSTVVFSTIKTLIMTSGEMEYDNLFFDNQDWNKLETVPYMTTTKILFVMFVFIMPIIIMNLLVGLAVDDIKTVQQNAVLKRIAMQVELVLNVEKILPDCLRDKWIIKTETLYPNQRNNFFKYYFSYQPVKKSIAEKVVTIDSGSGQEKKDKHDIEGLTRSLKKLQDEMEKIRYFMSEMASRQGVVKELGE